MTAERRPLQGFVEPHGKDRTTRLVRGGGRHINVGVIFDQLGADDTVLDLQVGVDGYWSLVSRRFGVSQGNEIARGDLRIPFGCTGVLIATSPEAEPELVHPDWRCDYHGIDPDAPATLEELWDTGPVYVADDEDQAARQAARQVQQFLGQTITVSELEGFLDDQYGEVHIDPPVTVRVDALDVDGGWDGNVLYPQWRVTFEDPDAQVQFDHDGELRPLSDLSDVWYSPPGIGTRAGYAAGTDHRFELAPPDPERYARLVRSPLACIADALCELDESGRSGAGNDDIAEWLVERLVRAGHLRRNPR